MTKKEIQDVLQTYRSCLEYQELEWEEKEAMLQASIQIEDIMMQFITTKKYQKEHL